MKTTVEIPSSLLAEAKRLAARQGTTVRALIEEALHRLLQQQSAGTFRLRAATFRGNGLQPGVREGSWDYVRELIYEGRGG